MSRTHMRIAQEEIFGPVVCVIKYDSDEEAVAIANDSIYGLGGGVFSRKQLPGQFALHETDPNWNSLDQ